MLRLLISSLFIALLTQSAHAQFSRFEPRTIFAAAQCELGLWAREARYTSNDPRRLRATIKVEGQEVQHKGGGFEIRFPLPFLPSGGASASSAVTQTWETSNTFNIHPDNREACARNRPDVGVLQCFREQRNDFLRGANFKCSKKIEATAKGDIKATIPVWILSVGPSGELSFTRSFTVTLTAPPPTP